MTRGIYNENLDEWLQSFARINRVTVTEDVERESDYTIHYGIEEFGL